MALNYPTNWDKGWQWPLQIGAGGKEEPYLKDGKWKLRVWDAKERKHYIYDFDTDTLELDESKEMRITENFAPADPKLLSSFVQNVASKNFQAASEVFAQVMQAKIGARLADERKTMGTAVLTTEAVISEGHLPVKEVQRVFDQNKDIAETELLCGVSELKVNEYGQVVSYVCESKLNEEQWHWFVLDKWDEETVVDEIVATDLKSAEAQAAKNLGKDWKRFYILDGGPGVNEALETKGNYVIYCADVAGDDRWLQKDDTKQGLWTKDINKAKVYKTHKEASKALEGLSWLIRHSDARVEEK